MRQVVFGLCAFLLSVFSAMATVSENGRSAREILDRVDDLFRGRSSHGRITMKVVTPRYARDLTLEVWSKGKERSLVRILSPRKEKGTCTLRSGENVWNYMPKVKRVLKVPSSMMGGSWMGSHFTNDDLVRGSRLAQHYSSEISFEGERDGRKIIELACLPRKDAPVVWGKVVVIVQEEDLLPLRIEYYDEDLDLSRSLTFHEKKDFNGQNIPSRIRMVPSDGSDAFTDILYNDLRFDPVLEDDFFSLGNLQRQGQR